MSKRSDREKRKGRWWGRFIDFHTPGESLQNSNPWETGMTFKGYSNHSNWHHVTLRGLSDGLLNNIYRGILQIKTCFCWLRFSGLYQIRTDLCFRCRLRSPSCNRSSGVIPSARLLTQAPWRSRPLHARPRLLTRTAPVRSGEDAGAFASVVWSHTIKHNRGARLPEGIWQKLSIHVCENA